MISPDTLWVHWLADIHLDLLRLMARVLLFVAAVVCSLLLLNEAHAAQEKNWVVIVAGSNGWYNYRHQVCFLSSYSTNIYTIISNNTFDCEIQFWMHIVGLVLCRWGYITMCTVLRMNLKLQ